MLNEIADRISSVSIIVIMVGPHDDKRRHYQCTLNLGAGRVEQVTAETPDEAIAQAVGRVVENMS